MLIDMEKLRDDLKDDSYGTAFGGGFGGALLEVSEIDNASVEELIEIAKRRNVDFREYEIEE